MPRRKPLLAIVDTQLGNLRSVVEAFRRVGAEPTIVDRPEQIDNASAVVIPGVGAFGDGMASLRRQGLVEALRSHALDRRRPLIGICLGMQLLVDQGEEHGLHSGLGLVPGRAVRLRPSAGERVPNIGWCDVHVVSPRSILFEHVPPEEPLYFAHSYVVECADPADVVATIEFGATSVPAAIERDNVFALQCHPEKSQDAGLTMLGAFWQYVRSRSEA